MNENTPLPAPTDLSRRDLLAAGAVIGGALAALPLASNVHAAGTDLLKIGLIGCGGRGTGAAGQALQADENVQLYALGDVFEDQLQNSLNILSKKGEKIAAKVAVKPERCFVGFDAYQKVIACCDVVLLCTPPGFRPIHLKAAVEAGKHVFAEKPVAVDAPGVRSVLETCAAAKKKNLSIVSGLCLRYHDGFQELVKRISRGGGGRRAGGASQRLPRLQQRPGPAGGLDRHAVPDAQLVQLRLALRRLQRRAARSFPRRLRLGDAQRVSGPRGGPGRPAGPYRPRQVRAHLRPLLGGLRVRQWGEAVQQLPAAEWVQVR